MTGIQDKENMPPPVFETEYSATAKSPSSRRTTRKPRSKSIGPGGLEAPDPLKENTGNRRKSAFIPTSAVKSILPTKEDEEKRKAARRKSLANRRVSFAPEATLHTWDVIEYMRDATTSSASSSEATRRMSRASASGSPYKQPSAPSSDLADPPSTPPEQVEEPVPVPSPAHQRDLHQKKRRRSSGIPPMNFNNPEDDFSSSPVSGSSLIDGSDGIEGELDDDGESTVMSLDTDNAAEHTTASIASDSSTGSSARLEAALRQASKQAGTRGIHYDENGDLSMGMAGDEVTAAFQPWIQKGVNSQAGVRDLSALQDQENINPFSPAFKAQLVSGTPNIRVAPVPEEDEDVSMDVTRAVGGILPSQVSGSSPFGDETMDITVAVGGIQEGNVPEIVNARNSVKRRRSSSVDLPLMPVASLQNSPTKSQTERQRHTKRRRSSMMRSSLGDQTMDLTVAVGTIESNGSPIKHGRRTNLNRRRSSGQSSAVDETMDLTTAVGRIQYPALDQQAQDEENEIDENEELTMELTTVLGGIKAGGQMATSERPETPQPTDPPMKAAVVTTPKDQVRFKEVEASPARKLLTPVFEKQIRRTPRKSPLKSVLKTLQQPAEKPQKAAAPKGKAEPLPIGKENVPTPLSTPRKSTRKSEAADLSDEKLQPSKPKNAVEATASPKPRTSAKKSSREAPPTTPKDQLRFRDAEADFEPLPRSPVLEKQLRNSPLRDAGTPVKEALVKDTRNLANAIKLLSTPRKETRTSPLKRLAALTPNRGHTPKKQVSPKKQTTPKRLVTPKRQAHVNDDDSPTQQLQAELADAAEPEEEPVKIQLQQFLDLTNIRFMELTTTKRRHTIAHANKKEGVAPDEQANVNGDAAPDLERCVVASACTVPMLELYQHSCRELKSYISEGRDVVREIEANTWEENPVLFQEYLSAPHSQRLIMDNQLKNVKTNARLLSKATWYEWRSFNLRGLKEGLLKTAEGLSNDDLVLGQQERLVEQVLPGLIDQHDALLKECEQLQAQADELASGDVEELDAARKMLFAADEEIDEKTRMIASLQKELADKENSIEAVSERKSECLGETKEAERVREECRGWSSTEVAGLKALESQHGWTIVSASGPTLTMTYQNQLQLFFTPSSFLPTATSSSDLPISLTYIADSVPHRSQLLTTEKRFFLQLMRAHLQCLAQSQTKIKDLLDFISGGWTTALSISGAVERLNRQFVTDTSILSDERLVVKAMMLLPMLQTKVSVSFEIGAAVGGGKRGAVVETNVKADVRVVYGEKYDEGKMTEFLGKKLSGSVEGWVEGVAELRGKLIARGKKR
ncbi:hypothetical protein LTR04_003085 [Oleoguttula sp. CCFEE 6159]|nr:hypothetical protein LTR04_003085 [Oleoguttula sp. CCFEE 6159]